jgi:hypothetical protein
MAFDDFQALCRQNRRSDTQLGLVPNFALTMAKDSVVDPSARDKYLLQGKSYLTKTKLSTKPSQ